MTPRTPGWPPPRTPRRHRARWALPLAAVFLLGLAGPPATAAPAPVSASVRAAVGDIAEYPLAAGSAPGGITTGSDGNLWFTETGTRKIGRLTPAGELTEFPLPGTTGDALGITAGPDGNLWFTDITGRIGRITTAGAVTEYALPPGGGQPFAITTGPDGNLWFTEDPGDRIGRITTAGVVTRYALPHPGSGPESIVTGPDGNLWFTEILGNRIGRITTGGVVTEYDLPHPDSGPDVITAGPDGGLWFTELFGNRIGRIATDGTVTEYDLPAADSGPDGIATGPDGNLWFTEQLGNGIGRITPAGRITHHPLPGADSFPTRITAGPDGGMWFTEIVGDRVGRIEAGAGRPRADLAVRLSAPATVREGDQYTCTVTVTNNGPFAAADTVVTLNLPRGAQVTGTDPATLRVGADRVSRRVGALGAGQLRVFHVTVRADRRSVVIATAEVHSRTPDPKRYDNTDRTVTRVTRP
ncbi:hypothetical protein [Streptomyces yangpuensis]|uniref:virginiamycin B lyase family protein n=1 Tax=Streptomyces yangpuensis TaxID=1648182 RepID=UPI00371F920E